MTLKPRPFTLWWSLLMLVPLVLLAALGIRGILASRRDALEVARAEATRVVEYGMRLFEQKVSALRTSARELPRYPQVPQPVESSDAQTTYEQAMDAPPEEGEAMLRQLLAEHPDATTAAGLPVAPLVEWHRLRTCTDSARFPERLQTLAKTSIVSHPSILTTTLLNRAHELAQEKGLQAASFINWRQRWEEDETLRSMLGDEQPTGKWIANGEHGWWIEADGDRVRVLPDAEFGALANAVAAEVGTLSIPSVTLSMRWSGRALLEGHKEGEPIAQRVSGPLSITAALTDPAALYRQQRRQTFWLAALLGVALLAVLGGFYVMQRALLSELQLNEQKSDFVASVSHELRAPVASMRLMLENLESGAVKSEDSRQEYLQLLGGECRRLSTLIENVLDFARIENGRKIYQMSEADVPALIRDAIQLLHPRASQRKQQLREQLAVIDPVPRIDALAIQQALINLIDNAIKFSLEGTDILVSAASRDEQTWEISVADQGPGIPKDERERIFDRFYRIGSELRRETQGSGIGLSIVKHTVEAHSGRIEIDDNRGAGAKFTLVLPYISADHE